MKKSRKKYIVGVANTTVYPKVITAISAIEALYVWSRDFECDMKFKKPFIVYVHPDGTEPTDDSVLITTTIRK